MYSASQWGVILADTAERRSWLVDGASTVLHLCRASLSKALVPWAPVGKAEQITSSKSPPGPDGSYETLTDPKNRQLLLRVQSTKYERRRTTTETGDLMGQIEATESWQSFEDLAREMYHFLEQIHDRTKKRDPSTIDLQIKSQVLVGFDFKDLLLETGHIAPRSLELRTGSERWLDMAVKLKTVNLFGSHFGELILRQCSERYQAPLCGLQAGMPTGRDYLAVSLAVLQKITGKHHKHHLNAVHIADCAYWTDPLSYFGRCECGRAPSHRCSALITKLSSRSKDNASCVETHPVFARYPNGAVIFGYEAEKLTKGHGRKRKACSPHRNEKKPRSQVSDSGVDVGSSGSSSSPTASAGAEDEKSSSGFTFLGAASGNQLRKSQIRD